MLIYDPSLDPYHSAIRLLAITSAATKQGVLLSLDADRIADYFLAHPFKLMGFKFPAEFRSLRAVVKGAENPYRHVAGNKAAFERMRPIFFAAMSGLVAARFVDDEKLRTGIVTLTATELPSDLQAAVSQFASRQGAVGKFLLSEFLGIPSGGNNGLKDRSGLIEYRYDIA